MSWKTELRVHTKPTTSRRLSRKCHIPTHALYALIGKGLLVRIPMETWSLMMLRSDDIRMEPPHWFEKSIPLKLEQYRYVQSSWTWSLCSPPSWCQWHCLSRSVCSSTAFVPLQSTYYLYLSLSMSQDQDLREPSKWTKHQIKDSFLHVTSLEQ